MLNQLSIPKKIYEYVDCRNKAIKTFEEILTKDNEIKVLCESLGEHVKPWKSEPGMDIDKFKKEIDNRLWELTANQIGLMRFMDSKALDDFRKELEENYIPFEIENIKNTFFAAAKNSGTMMIRGIVNVFASLSREYKNNSPFKIGEKIIINSALNWWGSGDFHMCNINHYRENDLNDIDRIFRVVDEKTFESRRFICELSDAMKKNNLKYENEYFKVSGFKNGNIHIVFKRLDLVKKVNQLIGEYFNNNAIAHYQ